MAITKEQRLELNGSGLFFFKTRISEERQLEILHWYRSLTDKERMYIDDMRDETRYDAEFFSHEDE